MGMVAGVTWFRTTTPSGDAVATSAMGAADMWVYAIDSTQTPSTEELRDLLPPGSVVEPFTYADGVVLLPGRRLTVTVRSINLEGLGRGALHLVEGRLPAGVDEVAISRSVASSAHVGINDQIRLEGFVPATVVGFIENPALISAPIVLQHWSIAEASAGDAVSNWLVTLPADAELTSMPPMFGANPRYAYQGSGNPGPGMLVLGSLVLIETVLIGAAAFAVSIRRRQHELGLLGAAGASRRQLAGTVLAEGIVVAGIAVTVGLVLGIGLIVLVSPWTDQITDRRNPSLIIDPVGIGLACAAGLLAGIAAAAAPAWTAARLAPVVALSGRRPPSTSARRTLLLGITLIATSVGLTATGAAWLLAERAGGVAPLLLAAGAITGVLGFGACSPWLVERVEWLGSRMPLAGRIALRDTARARSRTAPIITAILAGLAAAIAISTTVASTPSLFGGGPWMRPDQLIVSGQEATSSGPQVADRLSAIAAAEVPLPGFVSIDGSGATLEARITEDGEAPHLDPNSSCNDCRRFDWLSVATPALLAALGVPPDATELAPDTVLLLVDGPFNAHAATIAVSQWEEQWMSADDSTFVQRYTHVETLPALAIDVGAAANGRFATMFIAPETAARLGFRAYDQEPVNDFVIRLGRPVTEVDLEIAASLLADTRFTFADASLPRTNPADLARLIITVLSVVLALTVTAIAVALGESESRADQRALLAVGADPSLRRRIVAARAGVTALLAALLAIPAGLLPVWGLLASRDQPVVMPLPELLVIVVLLPLVAIAGSLLFSRPIPAWSAFREVSSD
jgi:putative ABC transport system permease protein